MNYDLNAYPSQRSYVEDWIKDKGMQNPSDTANRIATATGCPLVVVLQFMGELFGFTEYIRNLQLMLMDRSGVERVLGCEPGKEPIRKAEP